MAIDKTGKWWVGDSPGDVEEYLRAYSADDYPIHEFRLARCTCGSLAFELHADANEGVARRSCMACKNAQFICDSEEFWEEAEPERWKCISCRSTDANVGVGFALYDDDERDVHWLYVGVRCAACGILGCYADWKVGYGPSVELMDRV